MYSRRKFLLPRVHTAVHHSSYTLTTLQRSLNIVLDRPPDASTRYHSLTLAIRPPWLVLTLAGHPHPGWPSSPWLAVFTLAGHLHPSHPPLTLAIRP